MRKNPASLVVVPLDTPRRVSVTMTLAPARAAPEVSWAVPSMPLENWAQAGTAFRVRSRRKRGRKILNLPALAMDLSPVGKRFHGEAELFRFDTPVEVNLGIAGSLKGGGSERRQDAHHAASLAASQCKVAQGK